MLNDEEKELPLFAAPEIRCSKCFASLPLPLGILPKTTFDEVFYTEYESQISFPPDGWSATFGCPRCGRVKRYGADDVFEVMGARGNAADYHDSASLFSAQFPCAQLHCKAAATVYVHIESGGPTEYLKRLRGGFFQGKLPCGHDIAAVPEKYYRIERISTPLW
jgi:hypothetical protein